MLGWIIFAVVVFVYVIAFTIVMAASESDRNMGDKE